MLTTEILRALPADLEWMVLFRLSAIRPWATDAQLKAMFFLPEAVELHFCSHVVLSSSGRFLAPNSNGALHLLGHGEFRGCSPGVLSLLDCYEQQLSTFFVDGVDCIGLGASPPLMPVLMHLTLENGFAMARAFFYKEPSGIHYELLKAIGVEYLGGHYEDGLFTAQFKNSICIHLHSGELAGYSRTRNCNEFFLNHGEIDATLLRGLRQAADARIANGRRRTLAVAVDLAGASQRSCLAMTCIPPPPQLHFPYGDLVPLGFLLSALEICEESTCAEPRASLRQYVHERKQDSLWSFHTRRLVTATDSALVLQGLFDPIAMEELERFADGCGGYYPQLWSVTKQPGRMTIDDGNRHWCQSDFATTCLVRGLRADAGFGCVTPLENLEANFDTRSGLYFANPFLVDWALAKAIASDPCAAPLRARLTSEILAAMNLDYSFGTYDLALSSSLAILALAAVGYRGQLLRLAQLRLLEFVQSSIDLWPISTPFYSTFLVQEAAKRVSHMQMLEVNGNWYDLSFYLDTYRIISVSLAALALGQSCNAVDQSLEVEDAGEAHPRYCCTNPAEYIRKFALVPYTNTVSVETQTCTPV